MRLLPALWYVQMEGPCPIDVLVASPKDPVPKTVAVC
jgi:hypothetical protein